MLFIRFLAVGMGFLVVAASGSARAATPDPKCTAALDQKATRLQEAQVFAESLADRLESREMLRDGLGKPILRGYYGVAVYEPAPRVILFQFKEQRELTRTMLRFQEHYESPKYRGQIFSLKEFKEWYPTTRPHGKFSYFRDWGGFNFPSRIVDPFFAGEFKNITEREKQVLDVVTRYYPDPFYVVGGFGSLQSADAIERTLGTLQHEVGHSFYFRDPVYKAKVDEILARAHQPSVQAMRKQFVEMGYHSAVLQDEVHAYFLSGWVARVRNGLIDVKDNEATIRDLHSLFLATLKKARAHQR